MPTENQNDPQNPQPAIDQTPTRRSFLARSGRAIGRAAAAGGLVGILGATIGGPAILKTVFDASVERQGYHRARNDFIRTMLSEKEFYDMDIDDALKLASERAGHEMVTAGAITGAALAAGVAAILKMLSEPEKATGPVNTTPPSGGAAIG